MSNISLVSAQSQHKLLGEYEFRSIEDENDEKVIEKYSREGEEYTLTVGKKGGKKDGKATLVDKNNRVIAELTFDEGNLTGPCILCNAIGIPQFDTRRPADRYHCQDRESGRC